MNRAALRGASGIGIVATVLVAGACSSSREASVESGANESANAKAITNAPEALRVQANVPREIDTSRSVVQTGPRVTSSHAESSRRLHDVEPALRHDADEEAEDDHPVGKLHRIRPNAHPGVDTVLQSALPLVSMPAAVVNFESQGITKDSTTLGGTPPDTNGAVGPNHFVQVVNTAVAVWDKSGNVVEASKSMVGLWSGYVGTNAGNACATNDSGDPVVVYDQLADRWFITQFSLPNENDGPNFQCVAVSKTSDPTGAYWLYDFTYPGLNDYGKFGIWPDAYYATFNMFNSNGGDADFCAYDRVSMLQGLTATQQCFQQGSSVSGALPVSMDGRVPPPRGEPGFFMQLSDDSSLDLWKLHVDWTTSSKSKLTGPTNIKVVTFSPLCGNSGTCIPQPSPGNQLDSLSDRMMFRLTYRNFGTHESLMVNHSVTAGSTGGVRWYEIRSPNGTPSVFQQGTYAPADDNWRWMASLAQDQAQDMVLGFSMSSATTRPAVAWTGRLASDAVGVMGQGESILDTGLGVETGTFASNGQTATRWGDYSNLTVNPSDDCTFWYTQELYNESLANPRTWDTEVAAVKFPTCAANDFSPALSPSLSTVQPGGHVAVTVKTTKTKGTAESITLNVQDLPAGVTGAFVPPSVTAGSSATLTLTAAADAGLTTSPVVFTVIGAAPSAVHHATADVAISDTIPDAGPDSGGDDSGIAGNSDASTGDDSGTAGDDDSGTPGDDDSGSTGIVDSGTDANVVIDGSTGPTGPNVGDAGGDAATAPVTGGSGDSSGCGCRTVSTRGASPWGAAGLFGLAMVGVVRRRRRSGGR